MKKISILILFLTFLLSFNPSYSQSKKGNEAEKKNNVVKMMNKDSSRCIMQDSCRGRNGKGNCIQKDVFIDNDKDGINDNRCNGFCVRKHRQKGRFKVK